MSAKWWAAAAPGPLTMFCFAAGATHLLSALGHVFPDSHSLEKADHLGIVALIIGNPISSLMVRRAHAWHLQRRVCSLDVRVALCTCEACA